MDFSKYDLDVIKQITGVVEFPLERFINTYHLDDSADVNQSLTKVILDEGGTNSHLSNVKGYMTTWHLQLDHNAEPYVKFFNFLRESIYNSLACIMNKGGRPANGDIYYAIDTLWGAVYNKGDWCESHVHQPGQFSFCYYLNQPEGGPPLQFDDIGYKFYPDAGDLIIFPGWMSHSVPEQTVEATRTILAGNISF